MGKKEHEREAFASVSRRGFMQFVGVSAGLIGTSLFSRQAFSVAAEPGMSKIHQLTVQSISRSISTATAIIFLSAPLVGALCPSGNNRTDRLQDGV